MCRPDYFGIEYEINPWMDKNNQPDKNLALDQWLKLTSALSLAGVELNFIEPREGLPDMVFTANAGLIYKNQVVLSNFRPQKRRGEIPHFKKWLEDHGCVVLGTPRNSFFEGHGDALWMGENLICGHGFRSSETGVKIAAEMIDKKTVILKLADQYFYHLDTCLCPIPTKNLILYYPPAFDYASCSKIEALGETIRVSKQDAHAFVCNAVPVGNKLVSTPMSKNLKKCLEKRGIEVVEVNLSEFLKSGGAARCLTLFI